MGHLVLIRRRGVQALEIRRVRRAGVLGRMADEPVLGPGDGCLGGVRQRACCCAAAAAAGGVLAGETAHGAGAFENDRAESGEAGADDGNIDFDCGPDYIVGGLFCRWG